jgi:NADH-quinone oxidoreductase subunit F
MGYPHLPHERESTVLSRYFGDAEARTLAGWKKRGGYKALEKALGMAPADIVNVIKDSGLRGRGGAGFPTGMKWSFMKPGDGKPHYLCCNADESEPGTFKDRELMRWTPHALVDGLRLHPRRVHRATPLDGPGSQGSVRRRNPRQERDG